MSCACFFKWLISNLGFKNEMRSCLYMYVTYFKVDFKNEVNAMCCALVSLISFFEMLRVDFR